MYFIMCVYHAPTTVCLFLFFFFLFPFAKSLSHKVRYGWHVGPDGADDDDETRILKHDNPWKKTFDGGGRA